MDSDWKELDRFLSELMEQPPAAREAWLNARRRDRSTLASRLRSLFTDADLREMPTSSESGAPPRPGAPGPERELGPYRLERELGRGGQGQVYLAEDTRLGRKVALKVLTGFGAASPMVLQRFRREAEVASKLDHPGICTVYETGEHDGVSYIAMRFVDGQSLAQWLSRARERGLASMTTTIFDLEAEAEAEEVPEPSRTSWTRAELEGVLRIVSKTARALQAAHDAGIIHRDIKPGNIMITPDEAPVILDFGLARALESEMPTLTRSGDVFGTPAYMAPEQLQGHHHEIDERTDVWSLGVTLYECLALQRPFQAPTREGLYRTILEAEPRPVSASNAAVSRDLDVVVATALRKERDRRYQSAGALADELVRILERRPILARPIGRMERTLRWCRRNPVVTASLLLLLIGLCVTLLALRDARDQRERVKAASQARTRALDRTRSRYLAGEALRLLDQDPDLAVGLIAEGLRRSDDEACRSAAWKLLSEYEHRPVLDESPGTLSWVRLSPDGKHLVAKDQESLRLYDIESRRRTHRLEGIRGTSLRLAWSGDGRTLAYVEQKTRGESVEPPRIHLVDVADDPNHRILEGHALPVVVLAFSEDGRRLATAEWSRRRGGPKRQREHAIHIWSRESGRREMILARHQGPILALRFRGDELLSCSIDETLRTWDLRPNPRTNLREVDDRQVELRGLASRWRPMHTQGDGNANAVYITKQGDAVVSAAGFLWPTDVRRAASRRIVQIATHAVVASPDDAMLAFSPVARFSLGSMAWTAGKEAALWSPRRGLTTSYIHLDRSPSFVTLASSAGKPRRLLALDGGGTVNVFRSPRGTRAQRWRGVAPARGGYLEAAAISSDGGRAALVDDSGHLRAWRIGARTVMPTLKTRGQARISHDGAVILHWGIHDLEPHLLDTLAGESRVIRRFEDPVKDAAFSPDGEHVIVRTKEELIVVRLRTGEITARRSQKRERNLWIPSVAVGNGGEPIVARDGNDLIVAGADGALMSRVTFDSPPSRFRLSPDGERLIIPDGTASRVHDVKGDRELVRDSNHRLAVSPDGRRALAVPFRFVPHGPNPLRVRLRDLESGRDLHHLQSEEDSGDPYAFALGAKQAALPTRNGDVVLFDAESGTPGARLIGTNQPLRELRWSPDERWLAGLTSEELLVWDVDRAALHARLDRPSNHGDAVRFLDSGHLAVIGSQTRNLLVPLDPLPYLERLGTRRLTDDDRLRFGLRDE